MSSSTGIKVYAHSTKAPEPRFDGASGKIFGFLKQVQSAIVERGWTEINTVSRADGTPGTELWIPNYARHSMASLRAHVLTYMNGQRRQAQDSFAMYTMLQKSLEPSYFATVATAANEEPYTINGMGAGVLFLKAIIMDVHHDLKGKASTIRQRLMDLPTYIAEVKFDIKAFNDHVTSQMAQLDARGEQSTDLIEYLWKAYKAVPDTEFTKYIKIKKDAHDEGAITYEPKVLMRLALGKAELMKDQGEWLKSPPEKSTTLPSWPRSKTSRRASFSWRTASSKARLRLIEPRPRERPSPVASRKASQPHRETASSPSGRPRKPRTPSLPRTRSLVRPPSTIGVLIMVITWFTSQLVAARPRPTASRRLKPMWPLSRMQSATPLRLSRLLGSCSGCSQPRSLRRSSVCCRGWL
jgi:hypothetical protein